MFWHFFRREIESRYLGSLSGFAWALLHPALQLLLYATVFQQIFKARILGAEEHGFLAYVGVGFWAWTLFAEGTSRAVNVLVENAALIGKVAVPPNLLVGASVAATVAIHLFGYAVALSILALIGYDATPGAPYTESGALGLKLLFVFGPASGFLLAALIAWNHPLTELRHQEIRARLAAARTA